MFYYDFCFYLSKIQCIIASSNSPYVFILGDFNADIQSTAIFGAELIDFCDNNELCFIDKAMLFSDTFTYTSQAHGTTSWLDLRCQVNLLYLIDWSLIMLYVLTIFHYVLK